MKNYSPGLFCNLLISESKELGNTSITDNVNTQVQFFNGLFIKCLDSYAPLVTREVKRLFLHGSMKVKNFD